MDRYNMCSSPSKHRHRSRVFPGDSGHPSRQQVKNHFFHTISWIPNEFSGCTLKWVVDLSVKKARV